MSAINYKSITLTQLSLAKVFIISLFFMVSGFSNAASREYRSKEFLKAVVTNKSSHEIIGWLGRGADVNYFGNLDLSNTGSSYDWHGTALHWAAKHNKKELIILLLAHDAAKAISDSNDKMPFRYAQHKKIRKLLTVMPVPKDLTEDLGIIKHVNRFGYTAVPRGWDMDDTCPSA